MRGGGAGSEAEARPPRRRPHPPSLAPFLQFRRETAPPAGVAIVAPLFRTNIYGIVGGGRNPAAAPNCVGVWDEAAAARAGELSFRSAVRAVALRRDAIAVALSSRALLYSLGDLRLIAAADTAPNDAGLLALATGPARVMAAPGPASVGCVRVEHVDVGRSVFIRAHASRVAAIALTPDGALLASASTRGTLIRLHATADGSRLRELRRGADPAAPLALAFSAAPTGGASPRWLAAASDKGTGHLFALGEREREPAEERARGFAAARALAARLAPSFARSARSVAKFKLPPGSAESGCALAFGGDGGVLFAASASGCATALSLAAAPAGGRAPDGPVRLEALWSTDLADVPPAAAGGG
jgi:hypothetical protein